VLAEHLGQNKLSSLVTVTSWPDEQAEYKKGQGKMVTLDELDQEILSREIKVKVKVPEKLRRICIIEENHYSVLIRTKSYTIFC